MKKPLAYSYIRFSDDKQEEGDSLRRQESAALDWCKRHGTALDNHSYRDLGVSAFSDRHREGLALFLAALDTGKIPAGSSLLIENLDRLSRANPRKAMELFLGILNRGVHVVQLSPERIFRADSEGHSALMDLMSAGMEFGRGNSESAMRSVRVGANWDRCRTTGEPLPGKHPFWLDKTSDGYKVNNRSVILSRMFALAVEGHGHQSIQRTIRAEFDYEISRPYVRQLLRCPTVKGLVQYRDKAGKPIGEPVALYPVVISPKVWDAVQGSLRLRIRAKRVRDTHNTYIFNPLLRDASGGTFTVHKATAGNGQHKFIPTRYLDGKGNCDSFPISVFEESILARLKELNPADLLGKDTGADDVLILTGRYEVLRSKIEATTEALDGSVIPAVVKKLRDWQGELDVVSEELATARQRVASPTSEAWGELRPLLVGATDRNNHELRVRVRAAVSRVVKEMTCVFTGSSRWRMAFVRVAFVDSSAFRNFVILHRTKGNRCQEAVTVVDTFRGPVDELTESGQDGIVEFLKGQVEEWVVENR